MSEFDFSRVRFERNYYKMIGFKDLTIEDAYKEFVKFLKYFNLMGVFNYGMTFKFGTSAQVYRSYFHTRMFFLANYANIRNSVLKNDYGRINYVWYEDVELLFPFLPKNEYGFLFGKFWNAVYNLWLDYCTDNKLNSSEILVGGLPHPTNLAVLKLNGYFPKTEIEL